MKVTLKGEMMYSGNICIVLVVTKWQLEYGLICYLLTGTFGFGITHS